MYSYRMNISPNYHIALIMKLLKEKDALKFTSLQLIIAKNLRNTNKINT